VIVLRSHTRAFGGLQEVTLDFDERINLIHAANEGGKSTLQRFIIAMLYGQLRADISTQRRLDPWVEPLAPWNAAEYGGSLLLRFADGREIEIHRSFGREESRVEIRASSGEEIGPRYERRRNGDLLFAQHHLELSKELFESLAVVRENRAGELEGRDSLRDRIANLAESGDERISASSGLARLEQALEAVGSERAPTRPYRQALDRQRLLRQERGALRERRAEYGEWIRERGRLLEDIGPLEKELGEARARVLLARLRDTGTKVRMLEETDGEIRRLGEEIRSVDGDPDFPSHFLDELNQLEWAQGAAQKRLEEVRSAGSRALSQIEAAANAMQQIEAYRELTSSAESDRITEHFVRYMTLSHRRDERQTILDSQMEEAGRLRQELDGLGPAAQPGERDWHVVAQQAAEQERAAAGGIAELAEELSAERSLHAAEKSRRLRRAVLGALAALAAAALGLRQGGAWGPPAIEERSGYAIAGFLLAASALILWAALRAHRRCVGRGREILQLESRQARLRASRNEPQETLRRAAEDGGYDSVEAFLAASRQASQVRQRIEDVNRRIRETESERDKAQADAQGLYDRLRDILGRVGMGCTPGTLAGQIDAVRAGMSRFRDLESERRTTESSAESAGREEQATVREMEERAERIRAILDQGKVESAEMFRRSCSRSRLMLGLREKEASRVREFLRMCGGRDIEEWRAQLSALERQGGEALRILQEGEPAPGPERGMLPLLPPLPSVEEAEEEERRISARLSSAREQQVRLTERIEQAFRGFRADAEIEEDMAMTDRAVQAHRRNREALTVALTAIREIARRQQETAGPELSRAVAARFIRLCGDRYSDVKIDPDFQIRVRERGPGQLRNAESLSRGTQDQLYFILRFEALRLLSGRDEPCPCLLDEPFAAYDAQRIAGAFRILRDESEARQLFLFTCREDVRDMALSHGARLIRLG